MKNVLLFAASNNPESINGKLNNYTASLFKKLKTNVLQLHVVGKKQFYLSAFLLRQGVHEPR
jgi:hypothetical protein